MLTQRLTRPLAIGAAVVVIGGGAAGIISATSSNGSAGASTGQARFAAKAGPTRGLGRLPEVSSAQSAAKKKPL